MFCEKCGKELKDDWKKCPYCGQMIGGGSVRMEGQPEMSNQVASAPSERNFSDKKPKKKGKLKKILLGIGGVLLILVVIAMITPSGDDSSSSDNKESQEELEEIKTLEEAGGFKQWKENGFPGKVRANISIVFPLVNTDKNNYAVYIEGGVGVIMQEDEMPVKDWKWLMDAEPDEDSQKAYFNGILEYLGQKDEDKFPVFLISDVKEGYYSSYVQEDVGYTEIDLEWLMGQPEEVLQGLGFTYNENDMQYSLSDGDVLADCSVDDGTVEMIYIRGDGSDMPSFHGVRIGMSVEEGAALLADKYTNVGKSLNFVYYNDMDSGNSVGLYCSNDNITEIIVTHYTEEEMKKFEEDVSQEDISSDDDNSYFSEEEEKSVEEFVIPTGTYVNDELFEDHQALMKLTYYDDDEVGVEFLTEPQLNSINLYGFKIDDRTIQVAEEYEGIIVTLTWDSETEVTATSSGSFTGMDSGLFDEMINAHYSFMTGD